LSFEVIFAKDCTAPTAVADLAALLEKTFNGNTINCNDGSSFSTKFEFKCHKDEFRSTLTKNQATTLADGSKVFLVTAIRLNEAKNLELVELSFPSFEAYESNAQPTSTSRSNFVSMSPGSFAFYSQEIPKEESWLLTTWFVGEGKDKAKGYKIFTNNTISCQ
jgi:hypothetical protein